MNTSASVTSHSRGPLAERSVWNQTWGYSRLLAGFECLFGCPPSQHQKLGLASQCGLEIGGPRAKFGMVEGLCLPARCFRPRPPVSSFKGRLGVEGRPGISLRPSVPDTRRTTASLPRRERQLSLSHCQQYGFRHFENLSKAYARAGLARVSPKESWFEVSGTVFSRANPWWVPKKGGKLLATSSCWMSLAATCGNDGVYRDNGRKRSKRQVGRLRREGVEVAIRGHTPAPGTPRRSIRWTDEKGQVPRIWVQGSIWCLLQRKLPSEASIIITTI